MITELRSHYVLEGDIHSAGRFKPFKNFDRVFGDAFLMLWGIDLVLHLIWVSFKVIEFVRVPYAVVANVFEALRSYAEHGRRLRKIHLPVVFVKNSVPPRYVFSGQ